MRTRQHAHRHSGLLLCGLLALPGCLTRTLWNQHGTEVVLEDSDRVEFAVEAVGVRQQGDDPARATPGDGLLLQLRRPSHRGDEQRRPAPDPGWFLLRPQDGRQAAVLAELLASAPLGPIERCAIEVDRTVSPERDEFWTARIEIRGAFSPRLRDCALDEAAALDLLATGPVAAAEAAAPELARCIAAAGQLDWRVLLPWARDGAGHVLGCVGAATAPAGTGAHGIDDIDLLVRVGPPGGRCLRVPAAVTPVLAAVHRDPTTLVSERFVLWADCEPLPIPRPQEPLRSLACPQLLALTTGVEGTHDRVGVLEKLALTPFAFTLDALGEIFVPNLRAYLEQPPLTPLERDQLAARGPPWPGERR